MDTKQNALAKTRIRDGILTLVRAIYGIYSLLAVPPYFVRLNFQMYLVEPHFEFSRTFPPEGFICP